MIKPKTYESLVSNIANEGKTVFFFTADWCPDCQFIYPFLPQIEEDFKDFSFIWVDRDIFIDLAKDWDIFGIPSFVVTQQGKELGRLVNKNRKTVAEITAFLKGV